MIERFIGPALEVLAPGRKYVMTQTPETWSVEWRDNLPPIENTAIIDKAEELLQLWNTTEYQRQRISKYPPLTDLADALYHQSKGDNTKMEAYLAACDDVKQKYPKGNE